MARACKGCVWWQELGETPDGTLMGECRAYPARPKVMTREETIHPQTPGAGQEYFAVWPLTESDEWCGGFTTEEQSLPFALMTYEKGKMN